MEQEQHVCPVWVGRLLASPVRKIFQNPNKILSNYVKPGMKVLEVGPALGFFSIPMAKKVGKEGKIYCVDIQKEMLNKLEQRAIKAEVYQQVETRLSNSESFGINDLNDKIDFAFLFAVVHEIPDKRMLFTQVCKSLKPGAKVYFAEPKGHVSTEQFDDSCNIARQSGLKIDATFTRKSHTIVFEKP